MSFEKTHHVMSNTVGLEDFLGAQGADPTLSSTAIDAIEEFAAKHADGFYGLMDEYQLDIAAIHEALNAVVRKPGERPHDIQYIGLRDLRHNRDEQLRIYRMIKDRTLSARLTCSPCKLTLGKNYKAFDRHLKIALGTHKLQKIFDRTLGHDFSKIVKYNVLAIWRNYFGAVITGDAAAVSRFAALSSTITKTALLGLAIDGPEKSWVSLVERTQALTVK